MKHILITGAASGIGFDLTKAFLNEGWTVWAGHRDSNALETLKISHPQNLHLIKLDVTLSADIDSAFQKISQVSPQDFILINKAGIAVGGPLEALPIEEWKKLFAVNVFGLVQMTQKFLPLLRKTQGTVINVGSISGRIAGPFLSPYAGSKHAVRGITDSLRRELLPFGVKVVLLEPGPIKTEIWRKSLKASLEIKQNASPEQIQVYGSATDLLASGVDQVERMAVPVEHVTRKVVQILKSPNPKAHYLIGRWIRLQVFLISALPTKIADKILSQGFRGQTGK